MKNTKHFLALLFVALLLTSCDKEYNTIGKGLVDEDHFQLRGDSTSTVVTSQIIFDDAHPVQTGDLSYVNSDNIIFPYNSLGYYRHPVYGGTTANVLSQVVLSEYGTDFHDAPVISKVVLSVPYFSTQKTAATDTDPGTYDLDSVYTTAASVINLKMYRSNYFLNNFDGNNDGVKYYSNEDNTTLPGIEDVLIYDNNEFKILADEVTYEELDTEGNPEIIRVSPRLRDDTSSPLGTNLNIADFNWLIDPANETALSSSSNFKDFHRGIYFKATDLGTSYGLVGLNLSKADIEVFYDTKELLYTTDELGNIVPDLDENLVQKFNEISGSVKILFSGNSVNMFKNNFSYPPVEGHTYLNGGQGAMMTIDLFGEDLDSNGVADELEEIRAKDWLINEASLEFYVNQIPSIGREHEPDRIFLYDIENNKTLLDYQFDETSDVDTNLTQLNHLGKLERDDDGNGVKYKIRITEHITDLIRNDSTNVKLGLTVSNNVLSQGGADVKNHETLAEALPEFVFISSVNSHRGTVLYNENAVDADKKLKLRIYYTEADPDGIDNN